MEWRVIRTPDNGFVIVSSFGISIRVNHDYSGNLGVDSMGSILDFKDARDLIVGADFLKQTLKSHFGEES